MQRDCQKGPPLKGLLTAISISPLARQKCKYGTKCYICGFSFGVTYGDVVDGLIHVHHLRQLLKSARTIRLTPIADLRPVCPNCHAVIHHRPDPAYSIEEVQSFLRR